MMTATAKPTVQVKFSSVYRSLWMHWESCAIGGDVKSAYDEINTYLDNQDSPTYIIMDIRCNIFMPIKETIKGALQSIREGMNLGADDYLVNPLFSGSVKALS